MKEHSTDWSVIAYKLLIIFLLIGVILAPQNVGEGSSDVDVVFGILCDDKHDVGMWTAQTYRLGYAARMTDEEYSQYCGR